MGVDIGGIARGTRLIHDVGLLRSNPADRRVGLIWVQMALGIPGMMLLLRCTIISIEVGVHGVMAVAGVDRDRNRGRRDAVVRLFVGEAIAELGGRNARLR